MSGMELLSCIGDVDDRYILETTRARQMPAPRRRNRTAWLIAVAAAALLLAGCAAVVLKLDGLRLGQWQPVKPDTIDQYGDLVPTEVPRDVLSLQGFSGSPNYLAAQEWFAFEESYDPDRTILGALDEQNFQMPEAYQIYNCYSQEMIDKVDEICGKYDLKPMGTRVFDEDTQTFFAALGIRGVHKEGVVSEAGMKFCYPGGSFYMEGSVTLTGAYPGTLRYSLRCSMKDVFDPVLLYLQDMDSYDQWHYTMADGRQVLLAQKDGHALIVADRADSFLSVNIREYEDGDFGTLPKERAFLETLAETFDFSFQPQPVDIAAARARMEAQLQAIQSRPKSASAEESERLIALRESAASYGEYLQFYLDNAGGMMYSFPINPDNMTWAERDMNGDGAPELLVAWDGQLSKILGRKDGKVVQLCDMGTPLRLYEDNVFGPDTDTRWQTNEFLSYYGFYRLEGEEIVTVQELHYNEEKGSWYKQPEGDSPYYIAITQAEVEDIVNFFQPVELELRSIADYPME